MIKYKFKLYKNAFKTIYAINFMVYNFPKKLDQKHLKKNGEIPTTFQD